MGTAVMQDDVDNNLFGLEPEKVSLIRTTFASGATSEELKLFLYQISRTGLDPLAKQIYFQKRFNKRRGKSEMAIITGIDGYRLVADRTGCYAGNDDPVFDDEVHPRKATVTVYKIIGAMRCPFTASARWDQYYPGDDGGFMWRKMPHLMLGKCAEALALRKAFPAELSGLYIKEEMEQADREAPLERSSRGVTNVDALMIERPDAAISGGERKDEGAKDVPLDPVYTGTEAQRTTLRQAFEHHALENRDKHAIAAAMRGKPIATLENVIANYRAQHGAQQTTQAVP